MPRPATIFKFIGFVVFILTYFAGHNDALPVPLQGYHTWIEFGGLVGGLAVAFYANPPRAEWTDEQREAERQRKDPPKE